MQWIDANVEDFEAAKRSGVLGPIPEVGVCYRSECYRFRVALSNLNTAESEAEWLVWDMTGAAPMVLASGFRSHTIAMRFGDGVAASRALRVSLRLAAIGRAVAAGLRRLTA